MAEAKPQSMFDESYHDKLEQFKKRKNARLEQLHSELDGPHTPLLNAKTEKLAAKNPDASLPVHERLLEAEKKQVQHIEELQDKQQQETMKEYSYHPEITQAGKEFKRDKPLIESLFIWQDQADERIKAKQKQKVLRMQEENEKPINRAAEKTSEKMVKQSKYADMKPEDRLLAMQADALAKYSDEANKQPDAEELALKESTFSPRIDPRSAKLAASRQRQGDVFESLFNSGMQTEQRKKEMNKSKYEKPKTSIEDVDTSKFRENDILRRYEEQLDKRAIEMALAEEEDRERRRVRMTESSRYYLKKREEEIAKTGAKITYRKPYEPETVSTPQVCERTQQIIGNRPDITTRLYNMAEAIRQKQAIEEAEQQKIDFENYTFQPQTHADYEIKSTFEERVLRAKERREQMLAEVQQKMEKDVLSECTFKPVINGDKALDRFRKSAMAGTVYSEAAKSSELEVRAINSHIERQMKSRVEEQSPKKPEWTIEPTVQEPFRASYVSQNASAIRPQLDDEGARFLDEFDINMAAGYTGEVLESPIVFPQKETIIAQIDKNLTNFHKVIASVKYQQTENELYEKEREERRYYQAAGMV